MEPSTEGGNGSKARACAECSTANLADARFCKACGASMAPPDKCPKCGVKTEGDANFCSGCGAKLVGRRPAPAAPKEKKNGAVAKGPPAGARRKVLDEEKAKLPPPKPPSSNMMGNVALFVAAIIGMIAVIVFMNKDKPKEVSPFQGGPPMSQAAPPPPPPSTPASGDQPEAPPAGDPIQGEITLAEGMAGTGTIFIVLRNAGMPNRGPPIAVKKIDNPTFPVKFTVSGADVMMKGMPFMGPFDIYVRLDQDGNAMTKDAGDLVNAEPAGGVKAGTNNVSIALDKRL